MSPLWPSHLDDIVEEFRDCFDSMERYELLFEYAKKNPNPLHETEWNEGNQILGCQSRAHVVCSKDEEGLFILFVKIMFKLIKRIVKLVNVFFRIT